MFSWPLLTDRRRRVDLAEARVGLHVYGDAVRALEQAVDARTHLILEICGGVAGGLRLAGHDHAESAAAASNVWPAKNTNAVSIIAKVSAKNGTATSANSTAAAPFTGARSDAPNAPARMCANEPPTCYALHPTWQPSRLLDQVASIGQHDY